MDIPVVAMILRSGWVARGVLLILAVFSVASWGIILNRLFCFAAAGRACRSVRRHLESGGRIGDTAQLAGPVCAAPPGQILQSATAEHARILDDVASHGRVTDWSFFLNSQFGMVEQRLSSVMTQGLARMDRGLMLLAVISSVAPFLGLFGTVWGVMNSFFQIGNQGSASLPVVAPGIAEALITTIVGLAVAIPAAFFYNLFVHRVDRAEEELTDIRQQAMAQLRRDLLNRFFGGSES